MANSHASFSIYTVIIIALIGLSYLGYREINTYIQRKSFKKLHNCEPEFHELPKKDPVMSLDFLVKVIGAAKKQKLLEFFDSLFYEVGRTYTQRTLCKTHLNLHTSESENFKCVLSTRFEDWAVQGFRQRATYNFLGDGIFTTDGAFWSHSRAMIRPNFAKDQVVDLDQFERHLKVLVTHIPADGSTVDLQELFNRLTMDTSTEFLMGDSANSLSKEESENTRKFMTCFDDAMNDAVLRMRMGPAYHLWPHKKGAAAVKYVRDSVIVYVNKALELRAKANDIEKDTSEVRGKYIFLNELAKHPEADAKRIQDEVMNVLLAGRDTTAALLSSLWFALAHNPQVWATLLKEVDELGGELPTYEGLRNMPYIKYCCSETLRLYPPVPILGKLAIRDTVLPLGGGEKGDRPLFVPKGSALNYSMYSLHRQPSVYGADAQTFRPERWADPTLRPGWDYLPFGGGPRVCLGQQYALTEAYYVTIRLMQMYRRVEPRNANESWMEQLTITCCSYGGTKVGLFTE